MKKKLSVSFSVLVEVENSKQAKISEKAGSGGLFYSLYARGEDDFLSMKTLREIIQAVDIPVIVSIRYRHSVEAELVQVLNGAGIDLDVAEFSFGEDDFLRCAESRGFWQMTKFYSENIHFLRSVKWDSLRRAIDFFEDIEEKKKYLRELSHKDLVKEAKLQSVRLESLQKIVFDKDFVLPLFIWMSNWDPSSVVLMRKNGADGIIVGKEIFEKENASKKLKALVSVSKNSNDIGELISAQSVFG